MLKRKSLASTPASARDIVPVLPSESSVGLQYNPVPTCNLCQTNRWVKECTKEGNMVCSKCGLVLGRVISDELETRHFADEVSSSSSSSSSADTDMRISGKSMSLLEQVMGAGTLIENKRSVKRSKTIRHLAQTQGKLQAEEKIKLMEERCKQVRLLARKSGLNQAVTQKAEDIFICLQKKIWDTETSRQTKFLFASCILLAASHHCVYVHKDLLCHMLNTTERRVLEFIRRLQAQKLIAEQKPYHLRLEGLTARLNLLGSELDAPRITMAAEDILKRTNTLPLLTGSFPGTIVGACLYVAIEQAYSSQQITLEQRKTLQAKLPELTEIKATTIKHAADILTK